MAQIRSLLIVRTPFHLRAMHHLFPEIMESESSLFLYGDYVDSELIKSNKIELKNYNFSQKRIFGNPLKYVIPLRRDVKEIKNTISGLRNTYDFSDDLIIYLGSDKDVFTQLLLKRLSKLTNQVIAIDEGLGFYVLTNIRDRFVQLIYGIFTPLLFGSRLHYIKRLGTHPLINKVYLRDVELLAKKKKSIEYIPFEISSEQEIREIEKGTVLLYSFPEQDYLYAADKKISKYREMAEYLKHHGRNIVIKPHPREDSEVLINGLSEMDNVTILDRSQLGESIDYFEYEYIINVFSSVILDILGKNYPRNRLITLSMTAKLPIDFGRALEFHNFNTFKNNQILRFES